MTKKKIAVVMQKRFDKANNILKKIIHSNKYGRLIFINADIFMNRKESYFKSREWLTNKESIGGGILLHHGFGTKGPQGLLLRAVAHFGPKTCVFGSPFLRRALAWGETCWN